MGFVILFNAILIMTLGRPRSFKKDRRKLIELSAFKEPAYALFAVGIFFTLVGLYIAYFYVRYRSSHPQGCSLMASLRRQARTVAL